MKDIKKIIIALFPILLLFVALTALAFENIFEEEKIIQGYIERPRTDHSSKIPGRISTIFVDEGKYVNKGDTLAIIESKEIIAKLEQTKGILEAAKAKYEMTLKGAREEEIRAAENLYNQARHQFDLAEKTFNRIEKLYNEKVVSQQEYDQIKFKYLSAKEQMEAAKAKFDMALNGARKEETRAAYYLYYQALNGYNEAKSYYDEQFIVAPINGEISKKYIDLGEIATPGYPLFQIIDTNNEWATVFVKEDNLKYFEKDKIVKVDIPALDIKSADFRVYYVSTLGDFAVWRATKDKNSFDIKTFEIRMKPEIKISNLRNGMSCLIKLK